METEENNKLIADFMNANNDGNNNFIYDTTDIAKHKFHSSWDSLIPVVLKCFDTKEPVEFFHKFLNDAKLNYNKWFKNYNFKNKLLYQKIFRKNGDNNILRLKIINNSNFKTILLSNNKNINVNEIPTNCWIRSILEVYAIWINENGFGLFLRPILISFKKEEIEKYNFYEDSDKDNDNDLESDIFLKPNNIENNNVVNIISTSSSNENNNNNNKSSTSD